MSFLRLAALWALPLVLLPIVIHLVYRRRHPTIEWPAMMFIRLAVSAGTGPAKWRRRIILAIRTLIVLAAVLALARPLSSGALGIAANRFSRGATAVVLIDRSPSMQRRLSDGRTRQVAALQSVADTLKIVGAEHLLLIDSVNAEVIELDEPERLASELYRSPADATANLPAMLERALMLVAERGDRRADIWVCSDRQSLDWVAEDPRWASVASLASRLGVGFRFYLTDFPSDPQTNHSVSVTDLQWSRQESRRGITLSIQVVGERNATASLPVVIRSGGTARRVNVAIDQGQGEASGIFVPAGELSDALFGEVSIAADVNASDDRWYFAAQGNAGRPIALWTSEKSLALQAATEVIGQRLDYDWQAEEDAGASRLSKVAMLVWQGQLPTGAVAAEIDRFIRTGGTAVFFPPKETTAQITFLDVRWLQWSDPGTYDATLDQWDFQVERHCTMEGDLVAMASVSGSSTLIGRRRLGDGTVYFCGGDVVDSDSLFVNDGLALYALLSDVLAQSPRFAHARQGWTATGFGSEDSAFGFSSSGVTRLLPKPEQGRAVTEFGSHAGVYSAGLPDGDPDMAEMPLVAINRDPDESTSSMLGEQQLNRLAASIRWNEVNVRARSEGSGNGFVQEIWSAIWSLMIVAMLAEAVVSLPRRPSGVSR